MNCPTCDLSILPVINGKDEIMYINLADLTQEEAKNRIIKLTSNLTVRPNFCGKCKFIWFEKI